MTFTCTRVNQLLQKNRQNTGLIGKSHEVLLITLLHYLQDGVSLRLFFGKILDKMNVLTGCIILNWSKLNGSEGQKDQ